MMRLGVSKRRIAMGCLQAAGLRDRSCRLMRDGRREARWDIGRPSSMSCFIIEIFQAGALVARPAQACNDRLHMTPGSIECEAMLDGIVMHAPAMRAKTVIAPKAMRQAGRPVSAPPAGA
jgi:hypothetical protein